MRLTNNELLKAVRLALYAGTTAVVGLSSVTAFAQDGADAASERLDTIVVTGSNIRRVDIETANPVITIDRAQITKSGKLTVGDLVQELPSIAGAATNPQVNNGGGTGASSVSLRGLGSGRTLILIDGQRIINNDINAIPANVVERIEVLLDGASSTYGSDAIAGVVNFIMRRDYQGAEFSADYGISDRDDGERKGGSFTFGQSTDRGSVVAGINYNKTDGVGAGKRDFSVNALTLYDGNVYIGGSSRTPTGRILLPNVANADGVNLRQYYGCNSVTRIAGTNGAGLDNYRCFQTGGANADFYNYQPANVILVPQERTNLFALGNYKLTDNVEAYFKTFLNRTSSSSLIAPYPFDSNSNAVTISADNIYNPFGIEFGPNGAPGNGVLSRLTGVGQRVSQYDTQTSQMMTGLRGNFGDTSWRWDVNANFGHFSQDQYTTGYLNFPQLNAALGPSMLVGGVPTCVATPGDASSAIAGCVPLNIFVQDDPNSIRQFRAAGSNPFQNFLATSREATANVNGEVFDLPAGPASLAVGVLYRKDYSSSKADSTIIFNPSTGTCDLGTACTTELSGNLETKEVYAEAFIPILKDVPFASSLNVTLGTRYSKFNLAGNTTNSKIGVEWRPIEDLLLRGTVSEVFRAPGISELFRGAASDAPSFNDPCRGYISGSPGLRACGPATGATNIDPVTGIPQEPNTQVNGTQSGAVAAGFSLKPESGKSFDFGVVYDPSWLDGFSINADYYRIYLKDTIQGIAAQTVVDLCYADDNSAFCPFITRQTNGNIANIQEPTVNLGRLDTSGFDLGMNYRLPEFDAFGRNIGRFSVGVNATYIKEFDNQVVDTRTSVAGTYSTQFGNFPRIRGVGTLDWNMGPFEAGWRVRWVGNTRVIGADQANGAELAVGGVAYHNFQFGYTAEPINTQFQIGVDNAFDKQPPLFYQIAINANTDVRTYDTIGRYYWARATVKF